MSGYTLMLSCGLVIFLQAAIGLRVTNHLETRPIYRRLTRLAFALAGGMGLVLMVWGGRQTIDTRFDLPGVADIQLTADDAKPHLERIASALGVDTNQPLSRMADAIVARLPTPVWHMHAVQREALGQALDEIAMKDRFQVVVRSIPSNNNSIAFSDDVIAVLRERGWDVVSKRDFGINAGLSGILIAVSPSVKSNDEVPLNAKRLIVMMQKAGFSPYGAPRPGLKSDQFELVIGTGPSPAPEAAKP